MYFEVQAYDPTGSWLHVGDLKFRSFRINTSQTSPRQKTPPLRVEVPDLNRVLKPETGKGIKMC